MSQTIRACHGVGAFVEPLYLVGEGLGKLAFGRVPVCAKCRQPVGDVKVNRGVAIARKFHEESWVAMMLRHPHAPYNFVIGANGVLMPECAPNAHVAAPAPPTPELEDADAEFR